MGDYILSEAKVMPEGEGARVKRAFPTNEVQKVDPFLLFDEFFVEPPAGFPMHSHSSFEAITYMLQGAFEHEDSSGASGRIEEGEAQLMITGSGLRHSEMPGTEGLNHGLQLWVELPEDLKNMEPRYEKGDSESLPLKEKDGIKVRTIVGDGSPIRLNTPVRYFLVDMDNGSRFDRELEEEHSSFLYVISGKGEYDGDVQLSEGTLVLPKSDKVVVDAQSDLMFALASGEPFNSRRITPAQNSQS